MSFCPPRPKIPFNLYYSTIFCFEKVGCAQAETIHASYSVWIVRAHRWWAKRYERKDILSSSSSFFWINKSNVTGWIQSMGFNESVSMFVHDNAMRALAFENMTCWRCWSSDPIASSWCYGIVWACHLESCNELRISYLICLFFVISYLYLNGRHRDWDRRIGWEPTPAFNFHSKDIFRNRGVRLYSYTITYKHRPAGMIAQMLWKIWKTEVQQKRNVLSTFCLDEIIKSTHLTKDTKNL